MKTNPFNIPDLTPMQSAVVDFVEKHQGTKGFINTDNSENDTIWALVWDGYDNVYYEYEVKAIRVVGNGHLEIIYDNHRIMWSDNDIKNADPEEWHSLDYDDLLYYLPTLFSIAESIAEYVEDE